MYICGTDPFLRISTRHGVERVATQNLLHSACHRGHCTQRVFFRARRDSWLAGMKWDCQLVTLATGVNGAEGNYPTILSGRLLDHSENGNVFFCISEAAGLAGVNAYGASHFSVAVSA